MGDLTRMRSIGSRAIACAMAVLLLVALMPVAPVQAAATTWYVDVASGSDTNPGTADSPFKTITAGLAEASAGDTVRVAPGTYRAAEMNAVGAATVADGELFPLAVPSGVTLESSEGPEVTIIDGEWEGDLRPALDGPAPSSGPLLLIDGETGVTVEGFTVTGGMAELGGGAAVFDSDDVSFYDMVFDGNRAFAGAGMFSGGSSVRLVACSFIGSVEDYFYYDDGDNGPELLLNGPNEVLPNAVFGGGLAAIESDIELWDSEFAYNVVDVLGAGALFGGSHVEAHGTDFGLNVVLGEELDILEQQEYEPSAVELQEWWSDQGDAGIQVRDYGYNVGGGVAFLGSEAMVHDAWFSENIAPRGGAVFSDSYSNVTVTGADFSDNLAIWGAGVLFAEFEVPNGEAEAAVETAGIELAEAPMPDAGLVIEKCVFESNMAETIVDIQNDHEVPATVVNSLFSQNWSYGPVVRAESTEIWNCTLAENEGEPLRFGIVGSDASTAKIPQRSTVVIDSESSVVNSILWGNDFEEFDYYYDGPSTQGYDGPIDIMGGHVAYTNAEHFIAAHETGDGNISKDPMFVEPEWSDYRLRPGSPSIDAGTNDGAPLEDLRGRPRPFDGNLSGTAVTDMGAYEYRPEKAVRLGGIDRYATSVRIVRENFESADTVIIARGDDFADGLASSGLAGLYEAPLLLTRSDMLPSQVAAEIERLGASEAIIVGGRQAVSDGVRAELQGLGLTVERVAGVDRYQTAERIAQRIASVMGDPDVVFLVRGDEFPDALAVSPVAYGQHAPILLIQPDQWPAPGVGVSVSADAKAFIAGGEVAVSKAVEDSVKSAGMDVERIAGRDRYETAAQFAARAVDEEWAMLEFVGLATGHDFPDALTGGAAIGAHQGVLLLTPATALHSSVERMLTDNKAAVRKVEVFGGPEALSPSVMQAVEAAIGPRD